MATAPVDLLDVIRARYTGDDATLKNSTQESVLPLTEAERAYLGRQQQSATSVLLSTPALSVMALSAQEESANRPGAITTDTNNIKSYGTYQVQAYNIPDFTRTLPPELAAPLQGLTPGTPEFDRAFESLGNNPQFAEAQTKYAEQKFYTPAANSFQRILGVDLSQHSQELRMAIGSTSVQHGGYEQIFQGIRKHLPNAQNASSEDFIKALYASRKEYVNGLTDIAPQIKQQLNARYDREQQRLLSGQSVSTTAANDTVIKRLERGLEANPITRYNADIGEALYSFGSTLVGMAHAGIAVTGAVLNEVAQGVARDFLTTPRDPNFWRRMRDLSLDIQKRYAYEPQRPGAQIFKQTADVIPHAVAKISDSVTDAAVKLGISPENAAILSAATEIALFFAADRGIRAGARSGGRALDSSVAKFRAQLSKYGPNAQSTIDAANELRRASAEAEVNNPALRVQREAAQRVRTGEQTELFPEGPRFTGEAPPTRTPINEPVSDIAPITPDSIAEYINRTAPRQNAITAAEIEALPPKLRATVEGLVRKEVARNRVPAYEGVPPVQQELSIFDRQAPQEGAQITPQFPESPQIIAPTSYETLEQVQARNIAERTLTRTPGEPLPAQTTPTQYGGLQLEAPAGELSAQSAQRAVSPVNELTLEQYLNPPQEVRVEPSTYGRAPQALPAPGPTPSLRRLADAALQGDDTALRQLKYYARESAPVRGTLNQGLEQLGIGAQEIEQLVPRMRKTTALKPPEATERGPVTQRLPQPPPEEPPPPSTPTQGARIPEQYQRQTDRIARTGEEAAENLRRQAREEQLADKGDITPLDAVAEEQLRREELGLTPEEFTPTSSPEAPAGSGRGTGLTPAQIRARAAARETQQPQSVFDEANLNSEVRIYRHNEATGEITEVKTVKPGEGGLRPSGNIADLEAALARRTTELEALERNAASSEAIRAAKQDIYRLRGRINELRKAEAAVSEPTSAPTRTPEVITSELNQARVTLNQAMDRERTANRTLGQEHGDQRRYTKQSLDEARAAEQATDAAAKLVGELENELRVTNTPKSQSAVTEATPANESARLFQEVERADQNVQQAQQRFNALSQQLREAGKQGQVTAQMRRDLQQAKVELDNVKAELERTNLELDAFNRAQVPSKPAGLPNSAEVEQALLRGDAEYAQRLPAEYRDAYNAFLQEHKTGVLSSDVRSFFDILNDIRTVLRHEGGALNPQLSTAERLALQHLQADAQRARKSLADVLKAQGFTPQQIARYTGALAQHTPAPIPSSTQPANVVLNPQQAAQGNTIVHQRKIGTRTYTPIYDAENRMAYNATKPVRENALSRFRNAPRVIKEAGLEPLNYAMREVESNLARAEVPVRKEIVSLYKEYSLTERRNVTAYRNAQDPFGRMINKHNGVQAPRQLTPHEAQLDRILDQRYRSFATQVDTVRQSIGRDPLHKITHYSPLMRTYAMLDELGIRFNPVLAKADNVYRQYNTYAATPWRHALRRKGGQYTAEYDAVKLYERYATSTLRHIHISPFSAKVHELISVRLPIPGSKTGATWRMADRNPTLAGYLRQWNNYISAGQTGGLGRFWDGVFNRLQSNIAYSQLSGNLRSAAVQPSALRGVYQEVGINYLQKGIRAHLDDIHTGGTNRKFAFDNSNVLNTQYSDTIFRSLDLRMRSGRLENVLAATRENYYAPVQAIGDAGLALFRALDYESRVIAWQSAHKYATEKIGLQGRQAFNYADDVVIRTHGSGLRGEIAPIQRTQVGRIFTQFQQFVINDFNYVLEDVLKVYQEGPRSRTAMRNALRFAAATVAMSTLYELLGFDTPFPAPERELIEGIHQNRSAGDIAGRMLVELIEPLPIVGSARYGQGPGGAVINTITEGVQSLQGAPLANPPLEIGAELVGIPGAAQAGKSIRASERGQPWWTTLTGQYNPQSAGSLRNERRTGNELRRNLR
jgi:hypothetical protein